MKIIALLIIYAVISWGLGIIVCGLLAWRKKARAVKIAALFLFGGPILAYVCVIIDQWWIEHNFKKAIIEVQALCAKDGGDKIYKTVDNVEGVFQMRARRIDEYRKADGTLYKSLSDQYGMVDPYGYAQGDYGDLSQLFVGSGVTLAPGSPPYGRFGYWFVEQVNIDKHQVSKYKRIHLAYTSKKRKSGYFAVQPGDPYYKKQEKFVNNLKSRYGYITEDITTKEMRDNWIGAGRIKIIDLQTQEVLAVRTGYFRATGNFLYPSGDRWSGGGYNMCPFPPKNDMLISFLHSVLKPVQGFPSKVQLESIATE